MLVGLYSGHRDEGEGVESKRSVPCTRYAVWPPAAALLFFPNAVVFVPAQAALMGMLLTRLMGYDDFLFNEGLLPEGSAGVAYVVVRCALILLLPRRWAMRWAKLIAVGLIIAPVISPSYRYAPLAMPLPPPLPCPPLVQARFFGQATPPLFPRGADTQPRQRPPPPPPPCGVGTHLMSRRTLATPAAGSAGLGRSAERPWTRPHAPSRAFTIELRGLRTTDKRRSRS